MHRSIRFATGAAALLVACSLLAVVPAGPTLGLSPTACRVTVVETNAIKTTLQTAINAAAAGDHLTVRGVCHGTSAIKRNLTITGIRPAGAAKPVLDGDAGGTVITVRAGAKVTIKKLAITDGSGAGDYKSCGTGPFYDLLVGGGVCNKGTLTLASVNVHHNTVEYSGGGIFNWGTLILSGSTVVDHNTAGPSGGGIFNEGGKVTMKGTASVQHSAATNGAIFTTEGGTLILEDSASVHDNDIIGIFVDGATSTLTLNDAASVHHNATGLFVGGTATLKGTASVHDNANASNGGGVYLYGGTLVLGASTSIQGNTAGSGGGVFDAFNTLNDAYCGVQIHDNTPDDCAGS